MAVEHVNDLNFDTVVTNGNQSVLVDFWAPWCGPCRAMTPVVDQVAEALDGKARVVKVNVDEAPESAQKYGIQSIPAFVLFNGGEVVERSGGAMTKDDLLAFVDRQIG